MSSITRPAGTQRATNRRLFLQYLASSPLFAAMPSSAYGQTAVNDGLESHLWDDPRIWDLDLRGRLIKTPAEAIDVFDIERAAHDKQAPAHWGFVASGVDDNANLKANRADFGKVALMPRRMMGIVGSEAVDTKVTVFGETFDSPIFTCPAGGSKVMYPDGAEMAVGKATAKNNHLQMLVAGSSYSIEEIAKERGKVPWFQLYCVRDFDTNVEIIKRAEVAGATALILTIDIIGLRKSSTFERLRRSDRRNCLECHDSPQGGTTGVVTVEKILKRPNYSHLKPRDASLLTMKHDYDWDFLRRIRDRTKMKVIPKGILSPEDVALCVKHGMDGVYLSNHGGRADDFGISAISVLPEAVRAVGGKLPIFIDGGFRRGMDVAKALAMGATMAGIGRPFLWGLGSFGQAGVERVLDIMHTETRLAMAQAGALKLRDLAPAMVRKV